MKNLLRLLAFFALSSTFTPRTAWGELKTRNVVLIVSDGLRWQEVFTGADASLFNREHGGSWASPETLRRNFWNEDSDQRRKMLLPFFWDVVATKGQIFGNQNKGSIARVTNGKAFSYPGYNEMLIGHADPRIDSNEYGPNPNTTVFEWIDHFSEFHGKAAVFATWNAFKDIFNQSRSRLPMQVGWDVPEIGKHNERAELINELFKTATKLDDGDLWNSFLQIPLLDYVKAAQPRLLFVGYGETDNWAHAGRYDLVLNSAHQFDYFVRQLWETMQAMPQYRDQTTFIITTDHGRGSGLEGWKNHGVEEKGSENMWIAVIGPDTANLGERSNVAPVTQSQIAATIAELLGKDFRHDAAEAAPPLPVVGEKSK